MSNSGKSKLEGKTQLSRHFQDLSEGESVAIVRNAAFEAKFPKRLQGKTGRVEGKIGRFYVVLVKDQDKEKKFLVNPIHLKKIK